MQNKSVRGSGDAHKIINYEMTCIDVVPSPVVKIDCINGDDFAHDSGNRAGLEIIARMKELLIFLFVTYVRIKL